MEEDPIKLGKSLSVVFGFVLASYFASLAVPFYVSSLGVFCYPLVAGLATLGGFLSFKIIDMVSEDLHLHSFSGIIASIGFTVGMGTYMGIKTSAARFNYTAFGEISIPGLLIIFIFFFLSPFIRELKRKNKLDYDAILWYSFGISFHVFLWFTTSVISLVSYTSL